MARTGTILREEQRSSTVKRPCDARWTNTVSGRLRNGLHKVKCASAGFMKKMENRRGATVLSTVACRHALACA
uniref:Uncharacterized protein n=1 Tax=Oryza rufipogon TaxID=4529 RepID=A0A0E0N4C8_ORYRU